MDATKAEKPVKKQGRIPKLTREQIRQGLEQIPIDHILGTQGKESQLTHKQREFAKAVAMGKTKAQAYRDTYNAHPAPSTITTSPYKLTADPRIQHEIEAYKLAMEASKYRNPVQLREHLIHQLVQHSINPETPPAQQIKALELIGKLYEVGAFMERKETTIIHQSSSIKEKLIERLKTIIDVEPKAKDDGLALLEELQKGAGKDPTARPVPADAEPVPATPTHTIPLKQSNPFPTESLESESQEIVSEKVK